MTEKNLRDAFAGESMAHIRYLIFSEVADKEGYPNIAKLFKAIAYAEYVHAKNHYKTLNEVKDTLNNLEVAINGETYEVEEMYPAFIEVAKLQGEKRAQLGMNYALEAEKIHADLYEKARKAVSERKDLDIKKVIVCPFCGYTVVDEAPDKCPICGATKDKFIEF